MAISVSIVEDNESIQSSLAELIGETSGYECLSVYTSGEDALKGIPAHVPQVVLMDIHLPGISGVDCTRELKALCPDIEIVILTVYEDSDLVFQALEAGASGYLLKRATSSEILAAVSAVVSGGAPMSSHIARKVVQSFQPLKSAGRKTVDLTKRETEILDYVARGYVNKEIAEALYIGTETVRTHLKNIYEKLHVRSRTEAVVKYLHPQ